MSPRTEVLLWAERVVGKAGLPAHQILEIAADATLEVAQSAFRRIARISHPDLFRTSMTPDELELITTAYARVANAFQDIRSQRTATTKLRPVKEQPTGPTQSPPSIPTTAPAPAPPAAVPLSTKALVFYRKAEQALRRGDVTTALLQIKMAIATDPHSVMLRAALAEVEAEVPKKP